MNTVEGALAQRMITNLLVVIMVESGAVNRADAIETFQQAKARISATVRDPVLRKSVLREIDGLLQLLTSDGVPPLH